MNTETFNTYCELLEEKRILEARIDLLKPDIVSEMEGAGVEELTVGDHGVITMAVRRTYKYPPAIVKMEEDLKEAKTSAEAKGEAIASETRYPVFKAKKITG